MYKGRINANTALQANQIIPFETVYNTNVYTKPNEGTVELKTPGLWDIEGKINIASVAGVVQAAIYVNGTILSESVAYATPADTANNETILIKDQIRVTAAPSTETVKIDIRLSAAETVIPGTILLIGKR